MPLTTFDSDADKISADITLSGGDLVATQTSSSTWETCRSTTSRDASGASYCEFAITANGTAVMVGIGRWRPFVTEANMKEASWNDAFHWGYYSSNGFVYNNSSASAYGSTYTTGDVIGVLLKNGKLYFSKNGTWQNGGDPAAETGFAASGLTGLYQVIAMLYSTTTVTIKPDAAAMTHGPPTGAYHWDRDGDASLTLRDEAGTLVASTSIKWALFPAVSPNLLTDVPDCVGTTATDGSGVLALDLTGTTLADNATGLIIGSTTDGVAANQSSAFCLPVVVNVNVGA